MLKDLCFEIIEKCPNECKFCSSKSAYDKNKIILYGDFKRVIDYFYSNFGIEELSLSGGEPFLHPELYKMVEYSKTLGIRTVVFTSGVKKRNSLSEELRKYYIDKKEKDLQEIEKFESWNERLKQKIESYYDKYINPPEFDCITKDELIKLKNLGLDKIVFDYQAYESETDSYLMGRNEQKRISFLDSMYNASSIGLNVDIHYIPMKHNYHEIKDILEVLEILGIKNISILKFVPQGRGKLNDLELTLDELNEFMKILEEYRKNYSGNIRIGIPFQEQNTHKCTAGLEKLDIKFDGTILPCPAFKELDKDICEKYGIKYYNIYNNLEAVKVLGGTRNIPLCKKIYTKTACKNNRM